GEWRDIGKSPTGDTMKLSKKGRLALKYSDGEYSTVKRDEIAPEENQLVPVFRNGQLLKKWDFAELKERSEREVPESYYAGYIDDVEEMEERWGRGEIGHVEFYELLLPLWAELGEEDIEEVFAEVAWLD